ncbi:cell division protein FtsQ/DivIB [Nonomuraea sp. NEAU-A123]|uniref:cell division protein FtsQ/DivIB n=1 Tax=Nonomuraea sp. NEAU-A123 TaxID=2839649 RepID=UPI001BE48F43|nr:FtsQ-type POTRA domain-containing protein [Nonomuraea sp. NEAU-A123]MBT2228750.1 FtsQ-type POTRA domain-containing protein [Nonomuraea sp. NEAU-A123]
MKARDAFLVLLTAGVVGTAAWLVFFSPVLGVRSIDIVGNVTVPAERIEQQAGVPQLHPLATVDLAGVEGRVMKIRQLASAKVDRVWPGTLRIEVVEREPVAAVTAGGKAALIDKTGVVIEIRDMVPPGLPTLKLDRPAAGDPTTMAALQVIQSLPDDLAAKVRLVRASSPEGVSLELSDGRSVVWGGSDRGADKARILATLLRRKADVYDVSSPDVVTLK